MPKIADEPLEAIQLRLFKSDLEVLRKHYAGQFGVNRAVRSIVRAFITQTKAKANNVIDKTEVELLGEK